MDDYAYMKCTECLKKILRENANYCVHCSRYFCEICSPNIELDPNWSYDLLTNHILNKSLALYIYYNKKQLNIYLCQYCKNGREKPKEIEEK
jgi:hypothetical protein